MKKSILVLIALLLCVFSIRAQTSPAETEKLKQLSRQVVSTYKAGKIDDALILARQAVDLSVKVFGAEHDETASAYSNLGTLYRLKKKYSEAAENLQKAFSIYQLKPAKNGKSLAKTLDNLAAVYALDGDRKKAAETYQTALIAAENAFGKDSVELLPYLKSMTDVYVYNKKYDEAQEVLVRRYKIAEKSLPDDTTQLTEIGDEFICFVHQNFSREEVPGRQKQFSEATKSEEDKNSSPNDLNKIIKGGVVNTKAKNLVAPVYPPNARSRFATGIIVVKVTIDEEGNVISATPACSGDMDLLSASVAAAKKSKFTPTILSGTPVKVSGVIVYAFVR
jgi:TonB family protein